MVCRLHDMRICVIIPISTFLYTDTNECNSNPCVNGATCNDEVNAYNCTCIEGYTGNSCETGMCFNDPTVQMHRP